VLAYVFWHAPRGDDAARYCAGLAAFHTALADHPPRGFVRSWTLRVTAVHWLPPADAHYLDWYVVDDFAALGALNEGAVTGARQPPHDAVAPLARTGMAGIVGLLDGSDAGAATEPPGRVVLSMVDKPAGTSYADFSASLQRAAAGAPCWMRQMTLGPGPEFLVLGRPGAPALPWDGLRLEAVTVAP
jgi:hypothetical protein